MGGGFIMLPKQKPEGWYIIWPGVISLGKTLYLGGGLNLQVFLPPNGRTPSPSPRERPWIGRHPPRPRVRAAPQRPPGVLRGSQKLFRPKTNNHCINALLHYCNNHLLLQK